MELRYFLTADGASPFEKWFATLSAQAAAKVTTALARLEAGNASQAKPVGSGVSELRIDWGPGYRVYFGRDGDTIIVLLFGGSKVRQQQDIKLAKALWANYKARKKLN